MTAENFNEFQTRPFRPHRFIRGGDLQTLLAPLESAGPALAGEMIRVGVSDGDGVALHRNDPGAEEGTRPADQASASQDADRGATVVLVHGISGCHAASYMVRMARRFLQSGYRTYRLDMRACGAVRDESTNVSHAGRSDDVAAALKAVHDQGPDRPIFVVGVSLGGNQSLRMLGRIGAGIENRPSWYDQFAGLVAIAPPSDLKRCSDNMQRFRNRFYNRYFIRSLLRQVPDQIKRREAFQRAINGPKIKTLRDLDDRLTAPLSGFSDANEYYSVASSIKTLDSIDKPTLILAADNDPIVPASIFDSIAGSGSKVQVQITRGGGHAGYIGPRGCRRWLDDGLTTWFNSQLDTFSSASRPRAPFLIARDTHGLASPPHRHGQSSQKRDFTHPG